MGWGDFSEIPLCFFDSGPEAEVHRPKNDQTSSDMKGIEDSFQYGGDRIERPIHLPESFLKFFNRHPFGLKDHCSHIVFRPILCQKPSLLF
jgi:hypothetical protein